MEDKAASCRRRVKCFRTSRRRGHRIPLAKESYQFRVDVLIRQERELDPFHAVTSAVNSTSFLKDEAAKARACSTSSC